MLIMQSPHNVRIAVRMVKHVFERPTYRRKPVGHRDTGMIGLAVTGHAKDGCSHGHT